MKVSFVLLAHEKPASLKVLIETLLSSGSDVYVHYDASSPYSLESVSTEWGLAKFSGQLFHAKRVRVTWGEWSIVQATLNCLELARMHGYNADYFMLISGSCMPLKPIRLMQDFLEQRADTDFIESVDATKNRWITDGIQEERWESYHIVNWRKHKKLFSLSLSLQKKVGFKRTLPLDHVPYMGSQWWCLRAATIESILNILDKHSSLRRFYKWTWVPDELFFQTMVGNLIPEKKISAEILTRYKFNSCGVPRVYYDDDFPELLAENTFFARKISPRAKRLYKLLSKVSSMSRDKYQLLVNEPGHEYALALRDKIIIDQDLHKLQWYSLAGSAMDEYEYIKSIPNHMIIVQSSNKLVREAAISKLMDLPGLVICNNLFEKNNDKVKDEDGEIAYTENNLIPVIDNWHFLLGDEAFKAKGKTLVFSLGDNPLPYFKILRWKSGVLVVTLDDDYHADKHDAYLMSMYCNSIAMDTLGWDAHCNFVRLPFDVFNKVVAKSKTDFSTIDSIERELDNVASEKGWPSYPGSYKNFFGRPRLVSKSVIFIYTYDVGASDKLSTYFHRREDIRVYQNIFEGISESISIKGNDAWRYYLGGLIRQAENDVVVFLLDPKSIWCLRWLGNEDYCALFVIGNQGATSEVEVTLDSSIDFVKRLEAKEIVFEHVKHNKYCTTYHFPSCNIAVVGSAIDKYVEFYNDQKDLIH